MELNMANVELKSISLVDKKILESRKYNFNDISVILTYDDNKSETNTLEFVTNELGYIIKDSKTNINLSYINSNYTNIFVEKGDKRYSLSFEVRKIKDISFNKPKTIYKSLYNITNDYIDVYTLLDDIIFNISYDGTAKTTSISGKEAVDYNYIDMVTPIDIPFNQTTEISFNYCGKPLTITFTLIDDTKNPEYYVSSNFKTEYKFGDTIDYKNLSIFKSFDNNENSIDISDKIYYIKDKDNFVFLDNGNEISIEDVVIKNNLKLTIKYKGAIVNYRKDNSKLSYIDISVINISKSYIGFNNGVTYYESCKSFQPENLLLYLIYGNESPITLDCSSNSNRIKFKLNNYEQPTNLLTNVKYITDIEYVLLDDDIKVKLPKIDNVEFNDSNSLKRFDVFNAYGISMTIKFKDNTLNNEVINYTYNENDFEFSDNKGNIIIPNSTKITNNVVNVKNNIINWSDKIEYTDFIPNTTYTYESICSYTDYLIGEKFVTDGLSFNIKDLNMSFPYNNKEYKGNFEFSKLVKNIDTDGYKWTQEPIDIENFILDEDIWGIKVEYKWGDEKKSADLQLNINEISYKDITSISIENPPTATKYSPGQTVSLSGLKISVKYNLNLIKTYSYKDDKELFIIDDNYKVIPNDSKKENSIILVYFNNNKSFEIPIKIVSEKKSDIPSSIKISDDYKEKVKTEYLIGDKFNPSNLVVIGKVDSKDIEIKYENNESSFSFNPSIDTYLNSGISEIEITYLNSVSCKLPITVSKNINPDIDESILGQIVAKFEILNKKDIKTKYVEGDKFNPNGLNIKVTYMNGDTKDVSYNENKELFSFNPELSQELTTDNKMISVIYSGMAIELDIKVEEKVDKGNDDNSDKTTNSDKTVNGVDANVEEDENGEESKNDGKSSDWFITKAMRWSLKVMAKTAHIANAISLMPKPRDMALMISNDIVILSGEMQKVMSRLNSILDSYANLPFDYLDDDINTLMDSLTEEVDKLSLQLQGGIKESLEFITNLFVLPKDITEPGVDTWFAIKEFIETCNNNWTLLKKIIGKDADNFKNELDSYNEKIKEIENDIKSHEVEKEKILKWFVERISAIQKKEVEYLNNITKKIGGDVYVIKDNEIVTTGEIREGYVKEWAKNKEMFIKGTIKKIRFKMKKMEWDMNDLIGIYTSEPPRPIDNKGFEYGINSDFDEENNKSDVNEYLKNLQKYNDYHNGTKSNLYSQFGDGVEKLSTLSTNDADEYTKLASTVVAESAKIANSFIKNFNLGKFIIGATGAYASITLAQLGLDKLPKINSEKIMSEIKGVSRKLSHKNVDTSSVDFDFIVNYSPKKYNEFIAKYEEELQKERNKINNKRRNSKKLNNLKNSELLELKQQLEKQASINAFNNALSSENFKDEKSALKDIQKKRKETRKVNLLKKNIKLVKIELKNIGQTIKNIISDVKLKWNQMMLNYNKSIAQIKSFFTKGGEGDTNINLIVDKINKDADDIKQLCTKTLPSQWTSMCTNVSLPRAIGVGVIPNIAQHIVTFFTDIFAMVKTLMNIIKKVLDIISNINKLVKIISNGLKDFREIFRQLLDFLSFGWLINLIKKIQELFNDSIKSITDDLSKTLEPVYFKDTEQYDNLSNSIMNLISSKYHSYPTNFLSELNSYVKGNEKLTNKLQSIINEGNYENIVMTSIAGKLDEKYVDSTLDTLDEMGEVIVAYRSPIFDFEPTNEIKFESNTELNTDYSSSCKNLQIDSENSGKIKVPKIIGYKYFHPDLNHISKSSFKSSVERKIKSRFIDKASKKLGNNGGVNMLRNELNFFYNKKIEDYDTAYEAFYWYEVVTDNVEIDFLGTNNTTKKLSKVVLNTSTGSVVLLDLGNGKTQKVFVKDANVRKGDTVNYNGQKYKIL